MAGNLTAMIASIFSGSAVTADPYFEYTTLLLPGNGTNGAQNNTFLDASTNNFTITRNGNTTQGTFSPFSQTGWGNYFDGSGDSLTVPSGSSVSGTGNFTVEFFIYPSTIASGYKVVYINETSGGFAVLLNSTGTLSYGRALVAVDGTTTGTVTFNQWNHVAFVRSGTGANQFVCYINGSSAGSFTNSTSYASGIVRIGTDSGGVSFPFDGYLSNVRSATIAVYTGAFTVPTSPLTATQSAGTNISAITGTQTSLLTCQSNRFIDNSTNNFTITRNGDTRVVAFSPFNPTSSWSATTNGGSGYFDGTGDWLSAPANTAFDLGTGDFTIEGWFYYAENPPAGYDYLWAIGGNNTNGIGLYVDSKVPKIWNGSNVLTTTGSVPGFAWTHIAAVRSSGTLVVYQNGASIGSVSFTSNLTGGATAGPKLGRWEGVDVQDYFGYVNGFRIVKGTAVYTGAFTPPSLAPLTNAGSTSAAAYPSTTNVNTSFASSNTSLLLNFTNAGIYDATSKNDLETVGDAQISNTTAKWGSTSIKFDGTGDWLLNQSPIPPTTFGSGDFSIEMWIYATTSGTQRWLFDGRIATPADGAYPAIYISSGNVLVYYVSAAARITGTTTITTNTWHFVQVIRTSGTTKMYLNGTQEGSNYTDSTVYANPGVSRPIIGAATNLVQPFTGYIQDLRVTTGYARPTTTPTAAFPTL